jgi:hypothetical protein
MKRLSLGAAGVRGVAWAVLACVCAWPAAASTAWAQELSVVERSPEDRASADKLSELLREPVVRLHADSAAAQGADTAGCTGSVKRALILDSALRVVRLVRCRDGTTLSRTLDPQAAARTPYQGAFIAAELLAIDRELEAVETRQRVGTAGGDAAARSGDTQGAENSRRGAGPDGASNRGSGPANSGSTAASSVTRNPEDGRASGSTGESTDSRGSESSQASSSVSDARADSTNLGAAHSASRDASALIGSAADSGKYAREPPIALRLSAGAELNAWGAPFPGALRPSLSLGVSLQPSAASPRWLLELFVSAFGAGEVTRETERLAVRRSDGQLRLGGLYPLVAGRLELGGFAFLRGALTSVRYTGGASPIESSQLRWGAGAGLLASLTLAGPFQLYLHALVDFATSRSEYRVVGVVWLKDPAGLLWFGAGLLVHFAP